MDDLGSVSVCRTCLGRDALTVQTSPWDGNCDGEMVDASSVAMRLWSCCDADGDLTWVSLCWQSLSEYGYYSRFGSLLFLLWNSDVEIVDASPVATRLWS